MGDCPTGRLNAAVSAPAACCREADEAWPACAGPRVSVGGLQRACRLPSKHASCPLLRGVPAAGDAPPGGGLDRVLDGLYIASGAAAARRPDLAAVNVTHVVNAAPSVELCWHAPHLVSPRPRLSAPRPRAHRTSRPRARSRAAQDAQAGRARVGTRGHRAAATCRSTARAPRDPPRRRAQKYLVVDVLDGPHEPIGRHFARVNAFVAAARAAGGTVLVHCHGGVSRAAALVLAFLIGRQGLGFDDALAALRAARPVVSPNPGFVQQLRAFEAALRAGLPEADCDCGCVGMEGRLDPDTPEADGEESPLARAVAHGGRGLGCVSQPLPVPTAQQPARTCSGTPRFTGGNTL